MDPVVRRRHPGEGELQRRPGRGAPRPGHPGALVGVLPPVGPCRAATARGAGGDPELDRRGPRGREEALGLEPGRPVARHVEHDAPGPGARALVQLPPAPARGAGRSRHSGLRSPQARALPLAVRSGRRRGEPAPRAEQHAVDGRRSPGFELARRSLHCARHRGGRRGGGRSSSWACTGRAPPPSRARSTSRGRSCRPGCSLPAATTRRATGSRRTSPPCTTGSWNPSGRAGTTTVPSPTPGTRRKRRGASRRRSWPCSSGTSRPPPSSW